MRESRGGRGWRYAIAAVVFAALAVPGSAGGQAPGAPGLGDPYFRFAGNGGYEADDYELRISFKPRPGWIHAKARIAATATQALSSFNLDLRRLHVRSVSVDGTPAGWRRRGEELTVVPTAPIAAGAAFEVLVAYAGRPRPRNGPAHTPMGWNPTRNGSFVASEPRGAPTWFPANDHPSDKATYTIAVTVPKGLTAVANGSLISVRRARGRSTFVWRQPEPMASYLATATTGRLRLLRSRAAGFPAWSALNPKLAHGSRRALKRLPAIIRRLGAYLGSYPFSSAGAIVAGGFDGYVLETQTRPLFGEAATIPVMVHELAHQWFGDSVTPASWSEIWLSEGFATWSEWWWRTRGRDRGLRRIFRSFYRTPARDGLLWKVPPGNPGARKLFAFAVYFRGAMTVEALRQLVGDAVFARILRRWLAEHRHGSAGTAQLIALAEAESGRELDRFFDLWLYRKGKPRDWQTPPGSTGPAA